MEYQSPLPPLTFVTHPNQKKKNCKRIGSHHKAQEIHLNYSFSPNAFVIHPNTFFFKELELTTKL
jgi:hypothetical protein